MKTTLSCTLVLMVASFGARASAHSCSSNGNVNGQYNSAQVNPFANQFPAVAPVSRFGFPSAAASNFAPVLPQSRLTVVPSTPVVTAAVPSTSAAGDATNNANVGTVHVVPDADAAVAPKALPKTAPVINKPVDLTASTDKASKPEESKIADELKNLVGTWMAVARHGDGELTTVELQLDSKGWAKLTVPDANGEPSTITRRVELKDKELKLTGAEGALALGKLVEFNSRQLVLDRDGGQVTFVRP
jgi:hypothetical protein